MRIIIAPAKKMRQDDDLMPYQDLPVFLDDAEHLMQWMRNKSAQDMKAIWKCSDRIADQNLKRLSEMDLKNRLTPAILAYDGIAFQYMAPNVFEDNSFSYVQDHLRILSGFYGVLRPMDGVTSYRLEMQAKVAIGAANNLYEYWGRRLFEEVIDESRIIINLASKEYSRCIEKYLAPEDVFISCIFGELINSRAVQKGVHVKMARGQMVRLMAEENIEDPESLKHLNVLQYQYDEKRSDCRQYVFLK